MPNYILKFDHVTDQADGEQHELDAETLEDAKAMAAMLYAGASFKLSPPTSYRIVCPAGTEVYRFPEAG